MTDNLQELFFVDPWQLENKLGQILVTLQYENQQYKKFYTRKIQLLTNQLRNKDQELEEVQKSLQNLERKCQELQWKVIEKDNIIEDYQNKYKNVQEIVLDKVRKAIQGIDVSSREQSALSGRKNNDTNKRINISQYFIKSVQGSKTPSKTPSKIQSISTKYENDNQSLGLQSVVDCSQYLYPITNIVKNSSEIYRKIPKDVQGQQPTNYMQNSCSPTKAQYIKIESKKLIKLIEQERRQRKQNYKARLQERTKNISKMRQNQTKNKNIEKQRKQSLLEQNWKKISMFQVKNIGSTNLLQLK